MNSQIEQLISLQKENGAFDDSNNQDSVLISSIVLSCLNKLTETDTIVPAKTKVFNWLLTQKNEDWVFDKNLGINFCALSAIFEHDSKIIDGTALAKILTILTSAESQEGGPYYSHMDSEDKDIDLGVNAAIAYFLSLQDVSLPELDKLIEQSIESQNFNSALFSNQYLTIHLIAKFYKGEQKQILKEKLTNEITEIKDNQLNSNTSTLDIALYLEAMEIVRDFDTKTDNKNKPGITLDNQERHIMEEINRIAKDRFSGLYGDMKTLAMREIQNTIGINYDKQMSLMSLYMKQALGEKGWKISDTLVAEMGLANIFYWTAFIIYDDFWDEDEAASPNILPTANLYARHYSNFFASLLPDRTGFREFFRELMDKLDAANTWETIYCRTKVEGNKFTIPVALPDYDNYDLKYQPASGHVLGPVAMLYYLGYNEDSQEVKNLISYFKNYLIGMQINDDAHDWEEDMERGHLSTVVVMLLQDFKQKYPDHREIDLKEDKEKLQQIFWFKTIKQACQIVVNYTNKSRQALNAMTILENTAPLEHFIIITENVAKKALDEQKKSIEFLSEFKDKD